MIHRSHHECNEILVTHRINMFGRASDRRNIGGVAERAGHSREIVQVVAKTAYDMARTVWEKNHAGGAGGKVSMKKVASKSGKK